MRASKWLTLATIAVVAASVDTGVAQLGGPINPVDEWVNEAGDNMTGTLGMNDQEIAFTNGALNGSEPAGGLSFGGSRVCLAGPAPTGCGDVEGVVAGFGLLGGGPAGDVVLDVDDAVVQRRVVGSCGSGAAISTIALDGTVVCEPDDSPMYSAGAGLSLAGTTFAADSTYLQRRLVPSCGPQSFMRAANEDGTVACGSDADTVDGLQASQFLRSDQSGTLAGNLGLTGRLGIGVPPGNHRLTVGSTGPAAPASLSAVFSGAAGVSAAGAASSLPTPRAQSSTIWDGQHVYVFGGLDSMSQPMDDIVRFHPATGAVEVLAATLPSPRHSMSAVWDGQNAYLFGGADTARLDQIVRFNPATGSVTVLGSTLPTGRASTSAVWDGQYAYILGGYEGSASDQIVRFSPSTGAVDVLGQTLPFGRFGMATAWDSQSAYLFGGVDGFFIYDDIVRYTPSTATVELLPAKLPTKRSGATAVWDGQNAFVFGGNNNGVLSQIVRFSPASGAVTIMNGALPSPRDRGTAVWDGSDAYVFGGWRNFELTTDEIARYDPAGDVASIPAGASDRFAYLEADSAAGAFGINAHDFASDQPLAINVGWNGAHDVRLAPEGGNVGIGTTNPLSRLHVEGDIRSSALPECDLVRTDAGGLFSCGSDSDVLATLSCMAGQVAKSDGSAWACASDDVDGGDAQTVDGLDGGQLLRNDQSGTLAGSLTVSETLGVGTTAPRQRFVVGGSGPNVPASFSGVLEGVAGVNDGTVLPVSLPGPARHSTSAVSDGQDVYVFGGYSYSGFLNHIARFSPSTGASAVVATMPSPRTDASAIWDGQDAYIFGGYGGGGGQALNEIVRFNPTTGQATLLAATLPSPRHTTTAFWDGQHAYIAGGIASDFSHLSDIVRFTPSTGEVTTLGVTLPSARLYMSVVWDGQDAYYFGGYDSTFRHQILRFTPATQTMTVLSSTLPSPRGYTSAAWDGQYAYVFGGGQSSGLDQIVRFHPATGTVTTMPATLPSPRMLTSAAWAGPNAYIFGGLDGSTLLGQIVRYNPPTDQVSLEATFADRIAYLEANTGDGRFGLNAHDYGAQGPLPITLGWNGSHEILLAPEGGNVGIGTALPSERLDVAGNVRWSGTLAGGSVPWARLEDFPTDCPPGQFVAGVGPNLACGGPTGSGWTDEGTVVRLADATDRVGIGTANPTTALEVDGAIKVGPSQITPTSVTLKGADVLDGSAAASTVRISGGNSNGNSQAAGDVTLNGGGGPVGLNEGAALTLKGYEVFNIGGAATLSGGTGWGTGGDVVLQAGTRSSQSQTGANLRLKGGALVDGGDVVITPGSAARGVGIATNTPQAKLDVNGDLKVAGPVTSGEVYSLEPTVSSNRKAVRLFHDGSVGRVATSETGGTLNPSPLNLYVNGADRMTLTTGGSVGIGTTSPSSPLELTAPAGDAELTMTDAAQQARLLLCQNSTCQGSVQSMGTAFPTADRRRDTEVFANDGDVTLWPGGLRRASFKSDGKVGIGTDSPFEPLRVTGPGYNQGSLGPEGNLMDAAVAFPQESDGSGVMLGGTSAGKNGAIWTTSSGADLLLGTFVAGSPNERMRITSGGNVGVGIAAPLAPLDVYKDGVNQGSVSGQGNYESVLRTGRSGGSGVGLGEYTGSGHGVISSMSSGEDLAFVTFVGGLPNERARLTSSGDVGVGTMTPASRLDVAGDVRADGIEIDPSSLGGCDASSRGRVQLVEGTSGVADVLHMCLKSSADTYAWKAVVTG